MVFEERAGYLTVEECVRAHWQVACAAGAELREQEPVVDWQATDSGVVVRTAKGTYEAARLIVAAGAWSGPLLRDLDVTLRVVRKVSGWFPVSGSMVRSGECLSDLLFRARRSAFYGFPSLEGVTIKAAEHSGGEPVADPATVDRTVRPADAASLQRFPTRAILEAATTPARTSVCPYIASRPITTSSSTGIRLIHASSSPQASPVTDSSSARSSAKCWPTWRSARDRAADRVPGLAIRGPGWRCPLQIG